MTGISYPMKTPQFIGLNDKMPISGWLYLAMSHKLVFPLRVTQNKKKISSPGKFIIAIKRWEITLLSGSKWGSSIDLTKKKQKKQKKNPSFATITFNSFRIIILYRRTFDLVVYMAPRNLKTLIKTKTNLNSKHVIESYQYLSASMLIMKVMFQLCCLVSNQQSKLQRPVSKAYLIQLFICCL